MNNEPVLYALQASACPRPLWTWPAHCGAGSVSASVFSLWAGAGHARARYVLVGPSVRCILLAAVQAFMFGALEAYFYLHCVAAHVHVQCPNNRMGRSDVSPVRTARGMDQVMTSL